MWRWGAGDSGIILADGVVFGSSRLGEEQLWWCGVDSNWNCKSEDVELELLRRLFALGPAARVDFLRPNLVDLRHRRRTTTAHCQLPRTQSSHIGEAIAFDIS